MHVIGEIEEAWDADDLMEDRDTDELTPAARALDWARESEAAIAPELRVERSGIQAERRWSTWLVRPVGSCAHHHSIHLSEYTGHAELASSQLVSPQTSTPSGQVVPPVGQSSVQSLAPPQQSAQGTYGAQVMWQLELASQLIAQRGTRWAATAGVAGRVPQLSEQLEPFVHASRHGTMFT